MELNNTLLSLLIKQINKEYKAAYQYLSYYNYFKQSHVRLDKFADYFYKEHLNEIKHAKLLIDYIHMRNGTVQLNQIDIPKQGADLINSSLLHEIIHIFEGAYQLELEYYNNLLKIASDSDSLFDKHLCDFITSTFLSEQIESMYELNGILSKLRLLLNDTSAYSSIITIDKCM